jgi:integrase
MDHRSFRNEGPGDHNAIVRLLALTGQRRQEVGALGWSEIDLDKGVACG